MKIESYGRLLSVRKPFLKKEIQIPFDGCVFLLRDRDTAAILHSDLESGDRFRTGRIDQIAGMGTIENIGVFFGQHGDRFMD